MKNRKKDLLVGVWRSADEWNSSVEYRVSKAKIGYSVIARDTGDGEVADIFNEKWDAAKEIFSFATHWNSTGRVVHCRFRLMSKTQVDLTYTYTAQDALTRADKRKA